MTAINRLIFEGKNKLPGFTDHWDRNSTGRISFQPVIWSHKLMAEMKTSLYLLEELSESGIWARSLNVPDGDLGPENMSVHGRVKDRWLF